jgi:hypothetical protein
MSPPKPAVRSRKSHRNQGEQLKDEVYRQMFRLEESRAGAEMALALALLRAWWPLTPNLKTAKSEIG